MSISLTCFELKTHVMRLDFTVLMMISQTYFTWTDFKDTPLSNDQPD